MILPVELSPALALGVTLILTGALTCAFWRISEEKRMESNQSIFASQRFLFDDLLTFFFFPSFYHTKKTPAQQTR